MRPLTILFFGKLPPPRTGMTLQTEAVLGLLREMGHNVRVVNTSAGRLRRSGFLGTVLYLAGQTVRMAAAFAKVVRTARTERHDVLYFCPSQTFFGHLSDQILLRVVSGNADVRVLGHVHNGGFMANFERWRPLGGGRGLAQRTDQLLVPGESFREEHQEKVAPCRISVFHNHVAEQVICSEEEIERKWLDRAQESKLVITYLSNFHPEKGAGDLVEAMERLHSADPTAELQARFIGAWFSDAQERAFRRRLAESPAAEWMECVGPVRDQAAIRRYLLDSDVFCLPTYYAVEAQPVSLIEAMNAGNVVVSTRHASIPYMVEHGVQALLVEPRRPDQIAEAIRTLTDRSVWEPMSRAARRRYLERHTVEKAKASLMEILVGLGDGVRR